MREFEALTQSVFGNLKVRQKVLDCLLTSGRKRLESFPMRFQRVSLEHEIDYGRGQARQTSVDVCH